MAPNALVPSPILGPVSFGHRVFKFAIWEIMFPGQPKVRKISLSALIDKYINYISSSEQGGKHMCAKGGSDIQTFKHSSIQAFPQAIEHSKSPFKAKCCIQDKDSTIEEEITYNIQHTTHITPSHVRIQTFLQQGIGTCLHYKHLHLQHSHFLVNSKTGV